MGQGRTRRVVGACRHGREECRKGTLVAIPLEGEPPNKELYVIWRESLAADSPARAFGEWLAARADG